MRRQYVPCQGRQRITPSALHAGALDVWWLTLSRLRALPGSLALCRRDAAGGLPAWFAFDAPVSAALRRGDELTVVAADDTVPGLEAADRGWRALEVEGPLDLSLTGILAALAQPLAEAEVPLFALATVDTDLLLVKADRLDDAVAALRGAGHEVAA